MTTGDCVPRALGGARVGTRITANTVAGAATLVAALGCARPAVPPAPAPAPALDWAEVARLQNARDYFTLRDRVAATPAGAAAPPARYARALVEHAFNAPAASNATAAALLDERVLSDSLAAELRQVRVANFLRLGVYADGMAATDAALTDTVWLTADARRDLRNGRRIFAALADAPPPAVTVRGPATLRLTDGRVPVQVNDSARHYVFDTGANMSTLMRSEARALGLRVRPAGIELGTATDLRVTADLAVADRVTIGRAELRHVVFLVVDDRLLTFPDFRIPGLVGFPAIERLGEVQFGRDRTLTIPWPVPPRTARNLALETLTPITRARWPDAGAGGAPLVCRLDTGADGTQFYAPFYRRFRAQLDATTAAGVRRFAGVGGYREVPMRVLRPARLAVGDTVVRLDSADVLTRPIVRDTTDDYLDCNVGHDVLDAFPTFVINFRDMAFLLR